MWPKQSQCGQTHHSGREKGKHTEELCQFLWILLLIHAPLFASILIIESVIQFSVTAVAVAVLLQARFVHLIKFTWGWRLMLVVKRVRIGNFVIFGSMHFFRFSSSFSFSSSLPIYLSSIYLWLWCISSSSSSSTALCALYPIVHDFCIVSALDIVYTCHQSIQALFVCSLARLFVCLPLSIHAFTFVCLAIVCCFALNINIFTNNS